jgi:hypothetical protein
MFAIFFSTPYLLANLYLSAVAVAALLVVFRRRR